MKRNKYLVAAMLLAACAGTPTAGGGGGDDTGSNTGSGSGSGSDDPFQDTLNSRVVDYPSALRIAALKLTGHVPTLAEINAVASVTGDAQKTAYESQIQTYMNSPDFARQMFYFWRDTFKMGETPTTDTAPALAAELAVNNSSYMNLFTQAANTCPTFDEGSAAFTDAACTNGGPTAGVLTNPGVMAQFYSNFGFRRQRWIQEIFDCTAFPAEISATPTTIDGAAAPYTGVWPFTSISSPTNGGGRVNFLDTSAIICANCHTTINHRAPLFAYYDINGAYQSTISVPTPLEGAPMAQLTDYLPPGETTAWKYMVPAADIPTFGADMAADPAVATCGVARVWDWALGKTDIVDTLETVPADTISSEVAAFTSSGFKLKDMIYAVYTSDDFVKF
jgi:hypothetical protein|nr:hypothetical protein [Kofleriaceae bacterium]